MRHDHDRADDLIDIDDALQNLTAPLSGAITKAKPFMSKKPMHPIHFPLPRDTAMEDGSMFVYLPTLNALEAFWTEHRHRFSYAAQGLPSKSELLFLNANEWVFGPSKASVVNAVCRWGQVGIQCHWYDWATDAPDEHAGWFTERSAHRERRMTAGVWSLEDEARYQNDIVVRTPETYRGWWKLSNLPGGLTEENWFSVFYTAPFQNAGLSMEAVITLMQEMTFDSWKEEGAEAIEYMTAHETDSLIAYWRHEQAVGENYYGMENE